MTRRRRLALALSLLLALSALCLPFAGAAEAVTVPEFGAVKQWEYPDLESFRFVRQLGAGWDLGNTFDAWDDRFRGDDLDLEGYWCGVKTTREMIHALKEAGFSSIRIPVSWHNHVDEQYQVRKEWMDRVQQVVDWAIGEGLYVIVNTHHDNALENGYYPDRAHFERSYAYLSAIWQQMAERFRDYDDHLLLESMNEPRLVGTPVEWWFDPESPLTQESAQVINELNQRFVDIVRASGGNNAARYLLVPGYDASVDGVMTDLFALPQDTAENRLLVAVHAYTPYEFALKIDGPSDFDSSDLNDRASVVGFMDRLYGKFVSQGIPVVLDEYGALDKDNLQDRVHFFAWYVASASARCIPCFVWDNNNLSRNGERFAFLDRRTVSWPHPEIIEAIMRYAIAD